MASRTRYLSVMRPGRPAYQMDTLMSIFGHSDVPTDKGFLLVPMDRPHWIFTERIGSKKVRPIPGDLRYIDSSSHNHIHTDPQI